MPENELSATKTSVVPAMRHSHSMVRQLVLPRSHHTTSKVRRAPPMSTSQACLSPSSCIPKGSQPAGEQNLQRGKRSSAGSSEASQKTADASISSSYFLPRHCPEAPFQKEGRRLPKGVPAARGQPAPQAPSSVASSRSSHAGSCQHPCSPPGWADKPPPAVTQTRSFLSHPPRPSPRASTSQDFLEAYKNTTTDCGHSGTSSQNLNPITHPTMPSVRRQ